MINIWYYSQTGVTNVNDAHIYYVCFQVTSVKMCDCVTLPSCGHSLQLHKIKKNVSSQ